MYYNTAFIKFSFKIQIFAYIQFGDNASLQLKVINVNTNANPIFHSLRL